MQAEDASQKQRHQVGYPFNVYNINNGQNAGKIITFFGKGFIIVWKEKLLNIKDHTKAPMQVSSPNYLFRLTEKI